MLALMLLIIDCTVLWKLSMVEEEDYQGLCNQQARLAVVAFIFLINNCLICLRNWLGDTSASRVNMTVMACFRPVMSALSIIFCKFVLCLYVELLLYL